MTRRQISHYICGLDLGPSSPNLSTVNHSHLRFLNGDLPLFLCKGQKTTKLAYR